jgi:hypothetical protein
MIHQVLLCAVKDAEESSILIVSVNMKKSVKKYSKIKERNLMPKKKELLKINNRNL